MTMTNDPDLDETIESFASKALRLRQLERMAARIDEVENYAALAPMRAERGDLEEQFTARGQKLKISDDPRVAGRALLLIVEGAAALRKMSGRRPTPVQVERHITITAEMMERMRIEAEAEFQFARQARRVASWNAASILAAGTYLEASRG